MLTHHEATEAEKQEICTWKYADAYALYDMPSYAEMKEKRFGFGSPKMYVEAFYDGGRLVGFCNLFDDRDEVFFGIGVHPQACGNGYGREMTDIMYAVSQTIFPGKPLYLEVRTWNERAIRCYRHAGFVIDGGVIRQRTNAGDGEFCRMVRR